MTVVSAELPSLIHYFDSEQLWQQCVAVIKADGASPCNAWCWLSLDLSRFWLKAEEDWLIQQAEKDVDVDDNDGDRFRCIDQAVRPGEAVHTSTTKSMRGVESQQPGGCSSPPSSHRRQGG